MLALIDYKSKSDPKLFEACLSYERFQAMENAWCRANDISRSRSEDWHSSHKAAFRAYIMTHRIGCCVNTAERNVYLIAWSEERLTAFMLANE